MSELERIYEPLGLQKCLDPKLQVRDCGAGQSPVPQSGSGSPFWDDPTHPVSLTLPQVRLSPKHATQSPLLDFAALNCYLSFRLNSEPAPPE